MSESSCQRGPIVPKIISKSNDSSFEKFRVGMFFNPHYKEKLGFFKLRTLKIVFKGLLFNGQITADSVPYLGYKDKFLD